MTDEIRVCFSGDPTCSGCNPCDECDKHVRQCVIPVAVAAGGFDGSLLVDLHAMRDALLGAQQAIRRIVAELARAGFRQEAARLDGEAARLDLSRLPVSPETLSRTVEEEIASFRRGYDEGWERLHAAMREQPAVQAMLRHTPVGGGSIADASSSAPASDAPIMPRPSVVTPEQVAAAMVPVEATPPTVDVAPDGSAVANGAATHGGPPVG